MLRASCLCGAVVLGVARRPRQLTQCNCSVCRRYGALWAYYAHAAVRLTAGRRALEKYSVAKGRREFWRCRTCGCVLYHRRPGGSHLGVNARNMDPAEIAKVRIRMLDGASSWTVLEEYVQPSLFRSPAD